MLEKNYWKLGNGQRYLGVLSEQCLVSSSDWLCIDLAVLQL